MTGVLHEPFLNYFEDNYRWSMGLLLGLGSAPYGGADIGEVHHIGRRLMQATPGDDEAWFRAWVEAAEALHQRAGEQEEQGRGATAASSALRACNYYQIGERFKVSKDEEAVDAYRKALDCFDLFTRLGVGGPRIERVEVPYERGQALPAYLVHPLSAPTGPAPGVVFFDGLDITKELQYLRGVEELSRRGLACLIVDGPGNGEAIRFRGLPLRYDCEVAGSAALDYLEQRDEVDAARVAVMGVSLGGYFAPRMAAMEPRFAGCIAWGAIWDYHRKWEERLAAGFAVPMSVAGEHIAWTFGVDTPEQALERLVDWKLKGVAGRIEAPTLIVHGEDDQQVGLADAQALYDEISATDKTLSVYGVDQPGAQHCQVDSPVASIQEIADWAADRLG